jgi:hypothetical protein
VTFKERVLKDLRDLADSYNYRGANASGNEDFRRHCRSMYEVLRRQANKYERWDDEHSTSEGSSLRKTDR